MEGNFSLSNSYHCEQWLTFHHDGHMQQGIKILHDLSNSNVGLNRGRCMILGWFFLTRNSKLIKLGKGSSTSHPRQGCFIPLIAWLVLIYSYYPFSWWILKLFFKCWPLGVQRGTLCNVFLTFLLFFQFFHYFIYVYNSLYSNFIYVIIVNSISFI